MEAHWPAVNRITLCFWHRKNKRLLGLRRDKKETIRFGNLSNIVTSDLSLENFVDFTLVRDLYNLQTTQLQAPPPLQVHHPHVKVDKNQPLQPPHH